MGVGRHGTESQRGESGGRDTPHPAGRRQGVGAGEDGPDLDGGERELQQQRGVPADGVQSYAYYRAIKRPCVRANLAERFWGQDAAATQIINAYWLEVLQYQARVATGEIGSPRESTAAARFLAEQRERLRERLEAAEEPERTSEASLVLQRFKERYGDGAPVIRARRRVTEMEIEVAPGPQEEGELIGA